MYQEQVSFNTPQIRPIVERWLLGKGFLVNNIPNLVNFFQEIEVIDRDIRGLIDLLRAKRLKPDSSTIYQIRLRNGLVSWLYWVHHRNKQPLPNNAIRQKNWLEGGYFKIDGQKQLTSDDNVIEVSFEKEKGKNEQKKEGSSFRGQVVPFRPHAPNQEKGGKW